MPAAKTRPPFPFLPREGASADETGAALASLLDWLVKVKLGDLLEAGLTHGDVFRLVKAADDYRKGTLTGETLATIHELAPKLDKVNLFRGS